MDKKNNKIKRGFIPQSIGDLVKQINKKFTSKFGKYEFIIHSNWPNIVGIYFAKFSEPKSLTRLPNYENELGEKTYKNLLNVNVAPAAALEFQHYKNTILEKINSYFGYKAIIDLRIYQNYIPKNLENDNFHSKNLKIDPNDKISINEKVTKMKNNDLKYSLINLGEYITKNTK
tara:strand:+ start:312 stop:833 length:522 start_codon:yes stop_codon:yes gene_type:complete